MIYVYRSQSYFIWWRIHSFVDYQHYSSVLQIRQKNPLGNYTTIMLGIVFGKLCGFTLKRRKNSLRAKLKGVRARGQAWFWEGRSTMDHVSTLHALVEQTIFVGWCLYSCFVDSQKNFWHDSMWQTLGMPLAFRSLYSLIGDFGKSQNNFKWFNIQSNLLLWWHVFVPNWLGPPMQIGLSSRIEYKFVFSSFFVWKPCP